jgi:hypothetical protein
MSYTTPWWVFVRNYFLLYTGVLWVPPAYFWERGSKFNCEKTLKEQKIQWWESLPIVICFLVQNSARKCVIVLRQQYMLPAVTSFALVLYVGIVPTVAEAIYRGQTTPTTVAQNQPMPTIVMVSSKEGLMLESSTKPKAAAVPSVPEQNLPRWVIMVLVGMAATIIGMFLLLGWALLTT